MIHARIYLAGSSGLYSGTTGTPKLEERDRGITDRKFGMDFMFCFLLKSFSSSGGDGFGNIIENRDGFPPSLSTNRPKALPTPNRMGRLMYTMKSANFTINSYHKINNILHNGNVTRLSNLSDVDQHEAFSQTE